MPDCQFSETQFSFCFTFEFIQHYCPWSLIPFFPNTVLEGQPGYGFDVKLLGHLYFQYKIPKYITRRRQENSRQWLNFNCPFYRSKIDTDNEQHKLLKLLKTNQNEVLYIMPEFHLNNEISNNYINNEIVDKSMIFSIDDLPPHLSGYHYMCYLAGRNFGTLFSNPTEVKKTNINKLMQKIKNEKIQASSEFEEAQRIIKILKIYFNELELPTINNSYSNVQTIVFVRKLLLGHFNVLWIPYYSEGKINRIFRSIKAAINTT